MSNNLDSPNQQIPVLAEDLLQPATTSGIATKVDDFPVPQEIIGTPKSELFSGTSNSEYIFGDMISIQLLMTAKFALTLMQ